VIWSLHPAAERDIADALAYYAAEAGGSVARRFLIEFERAATLLCENAELGTPTSKGRRTFPMRIFPYSLVYRPLETGIRIIVVRHQHRKPGFGGSRR
jgi:plasmid stabilization system protein ParE